MFRLRLSRRAAEATTERRCDIRCDDHLLGRFLRRHLRLRGGVRARRRIQHPAVLDDLFDLRAIEGLVFEQGFRDRFELVPLEV